MPGPLPQRLLGRRGPPPWTPGSAAPPQAALPTPAPRAPRKGSCSLSWLWVWLPQQKANFRSVLLLSWRQPFPGAEAHSVLWLQDSRSHGESQAALPG